MASLHCGGKRGWMVRLPRAGVRGKQMRQMSRLLLGNGRNLKTVSCACLAANSRVGSEMKPWRCCPFATALMQ